VPATGVCGCTAPLLACAARARARTVVRSFASAPCLLVPANVQCSWDAHWTRSATLQPPAINMRVCKTTVNCAPRAWAVPATCVCGCTTPLLACAARARAHHHQVVRALLTAPCLLVPANVQCARDAHWTCSAINMRVCETTVDCAPRAWAVPATCVCGCTTPLLACAARARAHHHQVVRALLTAPCLLVPANVQCSWDAHWTCSAMLQPAAINMRVCKTIVNRAPRAWAVPATGVCGCTAPLLACAARARAHRHQVVRASLTAPCLLVPANVQCSRDAHWTCSVTFQPPAINTRVCETNKIFAHYIWARRRILRVARPLPCSGNAHYTLSRSSQGSCSRDFPSGRAPR